MIHTSPQLSEVRKYTMQTRQNALNKWLKNIVGDIPYTLFPLAGDASFRRYFRLHYDNHVYVVMDAPPKKETITPFINIGNKLASIGIHTPRIHAADSANGFALLEDLGDQLLLTILSRDNADVLYTAAITTLLQLQQCPINDPLLAHFDKTFMLNEISLFREWFLHAYLNLTLTTEQEQLLEKSFDWLTTEITAQPQVFIHRDYHSRNLIVIDQHHPNDMGVIDFQDAMQGPFTYDLVSLLKDCYIQWPREKIIQWLTDFYDRLSIPHDYSIDAFIQAFDLCGLQRHLKVLGIFCRLHLRDNKSGYLRDLPRTFNYVTACSENYPELQPLYHFLENNIRPSFLGKIAP